ncbi:MAG: glycosyltransferase family 4 protein [Verrucomicrobia bacterium]|nr:glycosyltransferase family 4 protein [Verrucomicrobiota bacterium]
MRIAQVAPLIESVPPKHYGGTERIVSYLTEELVRAGHDVTLFASGDSVTNARLVASCERSLRRNERCKDPVAREVLLLDHVIEHVDEFDLIHFHTGYLHFPICRYLPVPHVTTLHGRLDLPDLVPVFDRFRNERLISISNAQRQPLSWANWEATIYHGLPKDRFAFQPNQGDYLAFLGRISPEKRLDRAIEIAKRVSMPLKVAAKIDRVDRRYFKRDIEPLLNQSHVEWVGEISDEAKNEFLGNAYALVFPIDWPEPFGLVMIEAMACGTPVIAYESGSVPEVMEDGVTGFIVQDVDDAAKAVSRVRNLRRSRCRDVFERRFAASRMAGDYIDVYERLIDHDLRRPEIEKTRALSTSFDRSARSRKNFKIKDAQRPVSYRFLSEG